jgi:uncharacterized membrane protein YidH (DUF202 family)
LARERTELAWRRTLLAQVLFAGLVARVGYGAAPGPAWILALLALAATVGALWLRRPKPARTHEVRTSTILLAASCLSLALTGAMVVVAVAV